jgi:hypothetical protein
VELVEAAVLVGSVEEGGVVVGHGVEVEVVVVDAAGSHGTVVVVVAEVVEVDAVVVVDGRVVVVVVVEVDVVVVVVVVVDGRVVCVVADGGRVVGVVADGRRVVGGVDVAVAAGAADPVAVGRDVGGAGLMLGAVPAGPVPSVAGSGPMDDLPGSTGKALAAASKSDVSERAQLTPSGSLPPLNHLRPWTKSPQRWVSSRTLGRYPTAMLTAAMSKRSAARLMSRATVQYQAATRALVVGSAARVGSVRRSTPRSSPAAR